MDPDLDSNDHDSTPSWEPTSWTSPSWRQAPTFTRRAVGAVIFKDKRILSTGYNGRLPAFATRQVGCLREKLNVQSGMRHGIGAAAFTPSQNAIIQAATTGFR